MVRAGPSKLSGGTGQSARQRPNLAGDRPVSTTSITLTPPVSPYDRPMGPSDAPHGTPPISPNTRPLDSSHAPHSPTPIGQLMWQHRQHPNAPHPPGHLVQNYSFCGVAGLPSATYNRGSDSALNVARDELVRSNSMPLDEEVAQRQSVDRLEERRAEQNRMFGFKRWKGHLTRRPLSERSREVRRLYDDVQVKHEEEKIPITHSFGNFFYLCLFGLPTFLLYMIPVPFLALVDTRSCTHIVRLAQFYLWPFDRAVYIRVCKPRGSIQSMGSTSSNGSFNEYTPLIVARNRKSPIGLKDKSNLVGRSLWCFFACVLLAPWHMLIMAVTWLSVVYIPVCREFRTGLRLMTMDPTGIHVCAYAEEAESQDRCLCLKMVLERASNINFYKYKYAGVNVIMLNQIALVLVTLLICYVPGFDINNDFAVFLLCTACAIPLAHYIGLAIALISAQSNFTTGAILNASFGSIVEIVLYISALRQNTQKHVQLVQSALTGSLLGTMLLVPGLCMIIGGLKFKEQYLNPRSASVNAVLLFVSVAGGYAPSLFYKIYGSYDLQCGFCDNTALGKPTQISVDCTDCRYVPVIDDNQFFTDHFLPMEYAVALCLPITYIVGLVFTLKTHAHIHDSDDNNSGDGDGHNGHHVPEWSKPVAYGVLLSATLAFSFIAEAMVSKLQPVVEILGVSEVFIGVTLIAVIPNVAEIINGIQFALQNQVDLSIEIGNSIAVQVCLVQIPVLVAFSAFLDFPAHESFVLIFPDLQFFSVVFAAFIINFLHQDSTSNYFQGTVLFSTYVIFIIMFAFSPDTGHAE
eukprot:Clim_evm52s225 gene=Clim_evmTU52s225